MSPETYPGISFDDNGVCSYCLSHEPIMYRGRSALLNILSMYRDKGQYYDCIVPVSGGRDSAFVLYQMQKVYGMKVLAFNYESGFASNRAKDNLRAMIKALNVDFVSMRSNMDIQKRCLANSIKAWGHNPFAEPLPSLCYGCKNGYLGGAYKIARETGIPLIVMGDAMVENAQQTRRQSVLMPNSSVMVSLMLKFVKNPFYLVPRNVHDYLLMQTEFPLPREADNNPVRILHFFDFIKYDEEKLLSTIVNELNWEKNQNLTSSWRFDCEIHAVLEYMLQRKFGFTERDEFYSEAIRNGDMSREEALERLTKEQNLKALRERHATMDRVFEKLGLSEKEKNLILHC